MKRRFTSEFELYMDLQMKNLGRLKESDVTTVKTGLTALRNVLAECETECETLRGSRDYSIEGLLRQIDRARAGAIEKLKQFEATTLTAIRAGTSGLRSQLTPKKREGDPIVNAIKDNEIRNNLRALYGYDVVKIEAFYAGCDDLDVIAAIEEAPKPFAMVRPDVMEKHQRARTRAANPELAAQLESAETVEHIVASAFQEVGTRIQVVEGQ